MPWKVLWSVASHHSEPADPDLLDWIKDFLDSFLGFGPWTVVVLLGLLIVAIPLGVMLFYLLQQRRHARGESGPLTGDGP